MRKRGVFALILFVLTAFSGCQKTEATAADTGGKSVETLVTSLRTTNQVTSYSGIVESIEKTDLSFNIPGRVSRIAVSEGDTVVPAQILASIDTQDIQMQMSSLTSKAASTSKEIQKAEANLRFSEEDYNRNKLLQEAGVISEVALEQKALALEQASLVHQMAQEAAKQLQTEQSRLRSIVDDGTLKAESAGVVDAVHLEVSEYATPGKPVLTLRSEQLMAVTYVTAKDLPLLSKDMPVTIEQDGKTTQGSIASISDSADMVTRAYKVEITLPGDWGTDGAVVRIGFTTGEAQRVWVPLQSILSSTVDYVYVVREGQAVKQVIEVLDTAGDEAAVSGLKPGEAVIVSGMKSVIEGMTVKVIQ